MRGQFRDDKATGLHVADVAYEPIFVLHSVYK